MSSPNASADIQAMHATYVRCTGQQIALNWSRELQWLEVWNLGIRAPDIELVVAHMRRKAAAQRPVRSFAFRTFVGNPEALEEDIAEAKAQNRVQRVHPGKAAVLQASGRPAAPEPPPSRSVGEIVTSEKFLAGLDELKKDL